MATVSLDRAAFVELAFRGYVGFVRLFWRVEVTNMPLLPFNSDCCDPLIASLYLRRPKKSAASMGLRPALVLNVRRAGNIAQINYPVVILHAVNVVNFIFRPRASCVQPRKAMGFICKSVDPDSDVSVNQSAGNCARHCAVFSPDAPTENSGFLVVVQKFAQRLRGKIGLSHDAPRKLIGQRPASADNASGLRYFNVRGA